MTTAHTPGPWSLPHFVTARRGAGDCRCKYVLCEKYCGAICTVHFEDEPRKTIQEGSGDDPPLEEAKANARLIASAPDMLDALVDIEAIANGTASDFTEEQRKDERFCLGAVIGAARKAIRKAKGES